MTIPFMKRGQLLLNKFVTYYTNIFGQSTHLKRILARKKP